MDRFLLPLAGQAGFWVAIFIPIFVAIFLPLLMQGHPPKQPYLKRVAKKYSIPPLDLR